MIKSDYLKFLKKQEVTGKPIVDKIPNTVITTISSTKVNAFFINY